MNIYGVNAGEQSFVDEIDPEIGGPREYYTAIDLVRAPTRGSARALMAQRHGLEFIAPMSITLLEKRVDGGARVLHDDERVDLRDLWFTKGLEVNGA